MQELESKIQELESKNEELETEKEEVESERDSYYQEKEELEYEKEEVENERDSYYHEQVELEEQIREMTWKLENDIYEANSNECKYCNGVYGKCDLDFPEWGGNIVDTVIKINEDQKEKIMKLYEENITLKNVLSRINPHFECDRDGDSIDWDTMISDGGCIHEYVKLIKLQNELQDHGLFNMKEETDKINRIDFTGSKINGIFIWYNPNQRITYTDKTTYNGLLKHHGFKESEFEEYDCKECIKKICEYYKTSDQDIGISITLSTGGCVYLTTWNLHVRA